MLSCSYQIRLHNLHLLESISRTLAGSTFSKNSQPSLYVETNCETLRDRSDQIRPDVSRSTSSESDWSPDQPGQNTPTPQHEPGKQPPLPPYGPRLHRSARRSHLAAIAEQPPRVERKTKLGRAQNPARAAASDVEDSAWERAKALRVVITPRARIAQPSVSLVSEDYFEIQDPLSAVRTEAGSRGRSRGSESEGSRDLDPRLSPRLARLLRRVPGIGALTTDRMERLVESAHVLEYGSGEVIAAPVSNREPRRNDEPVEKQDASSSCFE